MTENTDFKTITEIEAAVILCGAVVVADGEVNAQETLEYIEQVRGITSSFPVEWNEHAIAAAVDRINRSANDGSFVAALSKDEVVGVAKQIFDKELQVLVLNSVFKIAYADHKFHSEEKNIVEILSDTWGI